MDANSCAEVLRSFINHRKRANLKLYTEELGGGKVKIDDPNDILLEAVEYALARVEEIAEK